VVVVVVCGCLVGAGRRGAVVLLFAFCAAVAEASASISVAMMKEFLRMMITSIETF
jgi:hypothetical protein